MAEGDTGAPRTGGASQGDVFTRREEASENYYIKQQEREKLEGLKRKRMEHEAELKKIQDQVDEIAAGEKSK